MAKSAIEWRARRLKGLNGGVRRLEVQLQEFGERSLCLACSMGSWLGLASAAYAKVQSLAYYGWCPCSDGHDSLKR